MFKDIELASARPIPAPSSARSAVGRGLCNVRRPDIREETEQHEQYAINVQVNTRASPMREEPTARHGQKSGLPKPIARTRSTRRWYADD